MKRNLFFIGLFSVLVGLFFLFKLDNKFEIQVFDSGEIPPAGAETKKTGTKNELAKEIPIIKPADSEPQKPLPNPPEIVKAIYITSWSASSPDKMDQFIKLIKQEKLNAVVVDIKDYSGYVAYDIGVPDVIKYKAKEIRISKINSFIKKLHDENIYAIARIAVFQDPRLAAARPDLTVKDTVTQKPWKDNKGLEWIDPASSDAWDYIIKIAKDASERGFDEINFDYIRFPSDGDLSRMSFPFYDQETEYKKDIIKEFFVYLRSNLEGIKISADLFGLTTVNKDDLGIGQVIEDAYANFDYVSPMVYPSHYASGFLGYKNPAQYPYEVVKYSMENAVKRLKDYNNKKNAGVEPISANPDNVAANNAPNVQLRPWLQVFDLGGKYGIAEIKAQIKASDEAGGAGWMLWDPSNNYGLKIAGIND